MNNAIQVRRWYNWYSPEDSPEERQLILKLDLLILPYAFVIYWVKYIDQTNINHAYVSGMSEELGFHRNELIQFQTIFAVGTVVGLLPFAYLFPRIPMFYLVPTLDLLWGLFTLVQYKANQHAQIMFFRFMVALFEASYFPAVHFVLGSWYRRDEIGRRGSIFYIGLTLGTLTSGLLQAAIARSLDGVSGLASWRWLFIITSIITFPLGLIGYFIWPGTPDKPNRLWLSKQEIELARNRLQKYGSELETIPFTWSRYRAIFTRSRFYVLITWSIIFYNTTANTAAFILWIKSLHRFDVSQINKLSTIAPALGIFYSLFIGFGADLFLGRPTAITLASVYNLTGLIILSIWTVPESAKWFAFSTNYSAFAVSPVLFGWVNSILRNNTEERALTLVFMTVIGQSTNVWIPLLVYPTVEAPKFPVGYKTSATMAVSMLIMTQIVRIISNREEERYASCVQSASCEESVDHDSSPVVVSEKPKLNRDNTNV